MNLRNLLLCLAAVAVAFCAASGARANPIINGGFETGDFTGWYAVGYGSVSVVTTDPYGGTYCAMISPAGNWEQLATWPYSYFDAAAGDVITWAYRCTGDASAYALASIYGPEPGGGTMLQDSFVLQASSGWQVDTYQATVAGSYGVAFYTSGDGTVQWYFDDVQVAPEPGSIGLLAAGLSALVLRRRIRRQK